MLDPTARDLIQRLADVLAEATTPFPAAGKPHPLVTEASAYLATPEPATGPTDEEIDAPLPLGMAGYTTLCGPREIRAFARAVLARYGHQPPQPIPLSERLPGPGDCDGEGRCYVWDWLSCDWKAVDVLSKSLDGWGDTFWLPAHALPLPEAEHD